jgi:putative ABC transport system permease protein
MKIGIDIWQEIYSTIKQNKLRTVLTGFSVSWGIFMLIVLLGWGNGLIHAFEDASADMAKNSIKIFPGSTSKTYQGLETNRRIQFDNNDVNITRNKFRNNVVLAGATVSENGITLSNKDQYVSLELDGVFPSYTDIEPVKLDQNGGRFINDLDISQRRKVIVIHYKTKKVLFRNESAIGKFLNAGGVTYQVVGIYRDKGNRDAQSAYIPFTTAQTIYNKADTIDNIIFTTRDLNTVAANKDFEKEYRKAVGSHHRFDPEDMNAMYIWNRFTQYLQQLTAKTILTTAVWIIGIFTLLSGIVGVSNIMLITVKERTREFGIRKALGASPASILWLVILESILITTIFGYIGMVAGIGVTEYMNAVDGVKTFGSGPMQMTVFKDPTVDIGIAIRATVTLIVAGTLAGFFPARKAVKIRPIEALRSE